MDRTLALEPNHFGALTGKGLAYYHTDKHEQAMSAFRSALKIHPWSTNVGTTLHHTRKQVRKRPPAQ